MSEMLTDPTEVREHLTNTLAEVAGEGMTHDFPVIFWEMLILNFQMQSLWSRARSSASERGIGSTSTRGDSSDRYET